MSDRVVGLDGRVPVQVGVPREDVISFLEGLLAQARSGDVQGLAIAALHPRDTTSLAIVGFQDRMLLGAVSSLQVRLALSDLEDG